VSRPRKKNTHLPPCVYPKHGAYYFVKAGRWERLGDTLASALKAYAERFESPASGAGLDELVNRTLEKLRPQISANTLAQYRLVSLRLKKIFREFSHAREVKPLHIVAIRKEFAATPNMANRILSFTRQVFDQALEEELVDQNPALGVKRLPEGKRKRLLTEEEIAAIHAHAVPRVQVVIEIQLGTGQRIMDVLRVKRANITDEGIYFEQQKTGARVLVPWTPELRAAVERAKQLNGNLRAFTLFHGRRGKPLDYRTYLLQWHTARRAAGVEDAKPNDMRAVAATWAKRQGKNATALLGHTSPNQTVRYLRDREFALAEGPSFGRLLDKAAK
jgi:integrase